MVQLATDKPLTPLPRAFEILGEVYIYILSSRGLPSRTNPLGKAVNLESLLALLKGGFDLCKNSSRVNPLDTDRKRR